MQKVYKSILQQFRENSKKIVYVLIILGFLSLTTSVYARDKKENIYSKTKEKIYNVFNFIKDSLKYPYEVFFEDRDKKRYNGLDPAEYYRLKEFETITRHKKEFIEGAKEPNSRYIIIKQSEEDKNKKPKKIYVPIGGNK